MNASNYQFIWMDEVKWKGKYFIIHYTLGKVYNGKYIIDLCLESLHLEKERSFICVSEGKFTHGL